MSSTTHPRTTGKSRRLAREQRAESGERVPGDPVPFRRADASMRPRRRSRPLAYDRTGVLAALRAVSATRHPGRVTFDATPAQRPSRRRHGATRHGQPRTLSAEQQRRAVTVPAKQQALADAPARFGETAGDVSRSLTRSHREV